MAQLDGLIQVAGVHDLAEARLCLDAGATLIGLPLRLPVNAEDLTEAEAAAVSRALPGKCCLITYLNEPREIVPFVRELGVSFLQLHGDIDPAVLPYLRTDLPETVVIKSLIIGRDPVPKLEQTITRCAEAVDAFITDSYDPETGAEGATGREHDWSISRHLINHSQRPIILAGGLNHRNVAAAIMATGARAVDAHTGVENAAGRKTADLVEAFVGEARKAL